MGFLSPVYLIALVLVPLIVAYHIFRPKSTQIVISSIVLWQKALTVAGRRSTWDRFVRNLLLILQVLTVTVCAILLSEFFVDRSALKPERYLIVIDTSASMAATDVEPDRLSVAKAEAISYVRSLPGGSEVALFELNSSMKERVSFTRDLRSIERAISELEVRNSTTSIDSLILLTAALVEDRSRAEMVALFTDGGFDVDQGLLDAALPEGAPLHLFTVGGDAHNVAIAGLEIRGASYGEGPGEVFAVVENFGLSRQVFPLTLYYGNRVLRSEYVELLPQQRKVITQPLQAVYSLPIRLEIAPGDHLSVDNSAQTLVRASGSRSALLVTRDNRNLYMALSAIPGLRVDTKPPGDSITASPYGYGYDLAVYDGTSPLSTLVTDTIVINSPLGLGGVHVVDEYEYASMVYIDKSHPVMRYVDERTMVAESGQILSAPPDAEILAHGRFGPLAVMGRDGRHHYAYFGFPFTSRSFVTSSSFPILVANLVSYMLEGRNDVRQLSPGDPIYIPVESQPADPAAKTVAKVTLPSGETRESEVTDGFFLFTDTYETGVYQVALSNETYGYAVNLFDRSESDISSRDGAQALSRRISGRIHSSDQAASSSEDIELRIVERIDFTIPLLWMALILLVVEWALYHRRWHL